ncbi:hypothetical protein QRX60_35510 [Amycolatopsis mongoliensis]|uniref:Uncharacterized protein n=1 Tax=Amycolatopsis mongoliensis TaxID=715475 RepID=A0A9Y2JIW2_9PSEU|nr:hypothetical protein [Amycolatopsis sp. 4-36]WIX99329.1 hypothetical protein QRX60_35510 [Amycolatopsis sp. 4-36]
MINTPDPATTAATGRDHGSRNDAHAYAGETPERRTKAGQGYTGKTELNNADFRFRAVLARLARDPDDDARREGAQIAVEATEIILALTRRAERATSANRRAEAGIAKLDAQLARRRGGPA